MRIWPTLTPRTRIPSSLYMDQLGLKATNRLVVSNLQGRQITGSGVIAKLRQREVDANGVRYRDVITHDAESGRSRYQSRVQRG